MHETGRYQDLARVRHSGSIKARRTFSGGSALSPVGSNRLDLRSLWRGDEIEVLLSKWCPQRHPICSEGLSSFVVVEIMLIGGFERRDRSGVAWADPNAPLKFHPDVPFEVNHPVAARNMGLTIRIKPDAQDRWMSRSSESRDVKPSRTAHERSTGNRLQRLLHAHRLVHALTAPPRFEPLLVEEAVLNLLHAESASPGGPFPERLPRLRSLVQNACECLNRRLAEAISLSELAKEVGCSPWHLARAFASEAGMSMHQYLMSLRLAAAINALRDGCDDLSGMALRLGFSSHSHFSAAFRRAIGQTPSDLRASFRSRRPSPSPPGVQRS